MLAAGEASEWPRNSGQFHRIKTIDYEFGAGLGRQLNR
jgi:hypothetical protein